MKKLDIIKKDSASTTIGVLGTAHGAGVTHLSLMLAVFMALVMGKSVALADMSGTDCLRQAGIMLKNNFRRKSKIFKMISIYGQADASLLSELMSENFEYIIVDFGADYQKNYGQFLMCKVKLIVGNLSLWKIHYYVEFMAMTSTVKGMDKWIYISPYPDPDSEKYFRKNFGKEILPVPCTPDPLHLGADSMDFLQELVSRFYKGRRR